MKAAFSQEFIDQCSEFLFINPKKPKPSHQQERRKNRNWEGNDRRHNQQPANGLIPALHNCSLPLNCLVESCCVLRSDNSAGKHFRMEQWSMPLNETDSFLLLGNGEHISRIFHEWSTGWPFRFGNQKEASKMVNLTREDTQKKPKQAFWRQGVTPSPSPLFVNVPGQHSEPINWHISGELPDGTKIARDRLRIRKNEPGWPFGQLRPRF